MVSLYLESLVVGYMVAGEIHHGSMFITSETVGYHLSVTPFL
jgi:hypothetical protein